MNPKVMPWGEYGVELEKLVKDNDAIAGINGGLYLSTGNKHLPHVLLH